MSKKERITLKRIEQDIIHSLKEPQEMSESSYRKWSIPCALVGGALGIFLLFAPKIALLGLLILVAVAIVWGVIEVLCRRHKARKVCIDDYEVTTMVLSDTSEEYYRKTKSRRRSERVSNYTLRFENGESWRIPENNYTWSEERPLSDFFIYQNSHRGDIFIVVTKKDTGKVAVAYHTDCFEYKP